MKRYTIGVLIGNANSPHTRSLMRGVHDAAEKLNVNVMFYLGIHMAYYYRDYFNSVVNSNFDYQYNVVYNYALLGDVDAIIISYGSLCIFLEDKNVDDFIARFEDIPHVILEDRDESGKGTSIISDNYNGMYRIVEHLVSTHGYRRFTYLSGPKDNTDAEERKAAFIDVLTKYNIPYTEDMVEVGDFSDCVEEQVNRLLDRYPDMEAMVCANDCMAATAYQEIAGRGYKIGSDIAVTGYDDWDIAESMTPPLTTVMQNEFDIGFNALERAVDLCNGKEPVQLVAPAVLKIRSSCGCRNINEYKFPEANLEKGADNTPYIMKLSQILTDKILLSDVNNEIRTNILKQLMVLVESNLTWYIEGDISHYDKKLLMTQMNELIAGRYSAYVSPVMLADVVSAYLQNVIKRENDVKRVNSLTDILTSIQRYIQSSAIKLNKDDLHDFEQDSMCMPLISRDMMSQIGNDVEFYKASMIVLAAMRARSSYLYLLKEPVFHEYGGNWECPEIMFLASYHVGRKVVSYEPNERPIITREKGIGQFIARKNGYVMSVFNLFLGEIQFGVLVTEIDPSDMILMNLASMQISIALKFQTLFERQKNTQQRLEKLIEEVNKKNKILGFISEYDELTGCLNRRGFMEKAMEFIHRNKGRKAVFIIGDLDHLKEINDCYGHVEGDFALKKSADILKEALGEDVLLARIGGDEFVALLLPVDHSGGKTFTRHIKESAVRLNDQSDKPYFVEVSTGFTEFICDPNKDFNLLIEQSDEMMYEAKKTRRNSVIKA